MLIHSVTVGAEPPNNSELMSTDPYSHAPEFDALWTVKESWSRYLPCRRARPDVRISHVAARIVLVPPPMGRGHQYVQQTVLVRNHSTRVHTLWFLARLWLSKSGPHWLRPSRLAEVRLLGRISR